MAPGTMGPSPQSAKSGPTVVILGGSWMPVLVAVIVVQSLVLLCISFQVPLTQAPCRCQHDATSALALFDSSAAKKSREERQQERCFMGGLTLGHAKNPSQSPPETQISTKTTPQVSHYYGIDGSFLPPGFIPFSEVLCNSKSDKQAHRFGHMYSEYLDPMRLQQAEVNLLEIGLKTGDSLSLWLTAFPRGKVYGLDDHPDPTGTMDPAHRGAARVHVFRGDQENVGTLKEVARHVKGEVGMLDFIVDDGGHTMGQQLTSFMHLFPLVRPGGVYFIEDLQTSYWSTKCHHFWDGRPFCYGGGPPGQTNTTIHLLKSFIDTLNADFMEDHKPVGNIGSGVYKVHRLDRLVGSVQCWRNMCAIRRKFEGSHF